MDGVVTQQVSVSQQGTAFAFDRKLLISTGAITSDDVILKVGAVGYTNQSATLTVGEFLFFARASDEIYEVRLTAIGSYSPRTANYLVSCLSPSQIVGSISRLTDRIIWDTDSTEQNHFSTQEMEFLKAKLLLFEKKATESFSTSEEISNFVHDKLDYLIQALERQPKLDWFYTSMGVFTSIAMALGVSAANDDKFWQLVKVALGIPVELLLGKLITF